MSDTNADLIRELRRVAAVYKDVFHRGSDGDRFDRAADALEAAYAREAEVITTRERWKARAEAAEARLAALTSDEAARAIEAVAWAKHSLGIPIYQNPISEFGQGAVEALRSVVMNAEKGLHPDARAALGNGSET